MRLLIAIAALVASVSASAGGLDGKAILCDRDHHPDLYGYEFSDGKSIPHYVTTHDGDTWASLNGNDKANAYRYTQKANTVEWGVNYVDRKTFIIMNGSGRLYGADGNTNWTASCEVSSRKAMIRAMWAHWKDVQRRIGEL